jgi:carbonic anhydrase
MIYKNRQDYAPPRGNVLLLSCMDQRLINELEAFMTSDNLTNRYDHLIVAGAALGVLQTNFPSWKATFFDHLQIAIKLHKPEDVYIVEHRNCGAYREFLGVDYGDGVSELDKELLLHQKHASELSREIEKWCQTQPKIDGKPLKLNVKSFLMDLRGNVELLNVTEIEPKAKRKASKSRKS